MNGPHSLLMGNDILVFASKDIGLNLVKYLLDTNAPVSCVIVADADDEKIIETAALYKIPAAIYTSQTEQQLVKEGKRYEWLLNLWSPHILGKSILSLANYRLNVHPSLVPYCRGNDTTAWSIRKGLPAGVSLIEMTEGVDEGDVYVQKEVEYNFPMKGKELFNLLKSELEELFIRCWPKIYSGEIRPESQKGPATCHTRKQTNQDRKLVDSSNLSLKDFILWGLAHDFSPNTTAEVIYDDRIYKVTLSIEEKDNSQLRG